MSEEMPRRSTAVTSIAESADVWLDTVVCDGVDVLRARELARRVRELNAGAVLVYDSQEGVYDATSVLSILKAGLEHGTTVSIHGRADAVDVVVHYLSSQSPYQ